MKIYNQFEEIKDLISELYDKWAFIACNGSTSDKYFLAKFILKTIHKISFQFEVDKILLSDIKKVYVKLNSISDSSEDIDFFFYDIKDYLDRFSDKIAYLAGRYY